MKKVALTVTLITVCLIAFAQDTTKKVKVKNVHSTSEYKPATESNNFELNFIPLNSKPIQLTYIRYRRFLTELTAFRLGFGLNYSSTSVDTIFDSNVTTDARIAAEATTSMVGWNIKPGYEKHFKGTKRLSPYIGGELDLAGQSYKRVNPDGLLDPATDIVTATTTRNENKSGFFRLGVNFVTGFDLYITKHLYLGSEFGFGLQYIAFSKLKVTSSPAPALPLTQPDDVSQGSAVNIGPNFNSSIRLGFIF